MKCYLFSNFTLKVWSVATFIFLTYSCANIVAPTGGEKDEISPVIVRSIPKNQTVDFKAREIIIEFDEFIQLVDPQTKIIISPPFILPPQYTVSKKQLKIKLVDSLLPNTTYSINFGESVCDLNEKNPIKDLTYTFSTGKTLDSLSITGRVLNIQTGKPEKNTIVLLHKPDIDSALFNTRPLYFSRCDDDGYFKISHLRNATYNIFALTDINSNYNYDSQKEMIANLDSSISVTTNIQGLTLGLVRQPINRIFIKEKRWISNNHLQILFNEPVDYQVSISNLPAHSYFIDQNIPSEMVNVWVKDSILDSITLVCSPVDLIETVPFGKIKLGEIKENKVLFIQTDSIVSNLQQIQLRATIPCKITDSATAYLVIDSVKVPVGLEFSDNIWSTKFILSTSLIPNKKYGLIISKGAFEDFNGNASKLIRLDFTTNDPSNFGDIRLLINVLGADEQFIIELSNVLDPSKKFTWTIGGNEYEEIYSRYISPGQYELRAISDANKNGRWDPGNMLKKILPEKIKHFSQLVSVKANWENEIVISLP